MKNLTTRAEHVPVPIDPAGGSRPRTIRGYVMLGLALATCPCHLPVLLVLLAGTGLGAYLRDNLWLTAAALTGVFVVSLLLGLRWIGRGERAATKTG
jgi:mercuric ion transport protein